MASSILNSDDGVISGTSGLKSTGGDDGVLVFQSKGTETARINTDKQIVAAAGTASLPIYSTTGDTNTGIFFPAADTIAFAEGGAEAMRINSSGQVGINTTAPDAPLTIQANSDGWAAKIFGRSTADYGEIGFYQNNATTLIGSVNGNTTTGLNFRALNTNIAFFTGTFGSNERMRIDSSGNVGIGTTSPDELLDVNGNAAIGSTSNSFGEIRFFNSTATAGTTRIRGNANSLLFFTGNAERARITDGGDFLIGTTSLGALSAKVHIATTAANGNRGLEFTGNVNTFSQQVTFNNTNGTVGSISTDGNATTFSTSSDYRLKENIAPMTGALARITQLKPCTYTWKADSSAGEGFIAHELQEVAPYAVSGEKDGEQMQGVDYGKITPLLTAALQEAIAEIQSLKARVAELEAK